MVLKRTSSDSQLLQHKDLLKVRVVGNPMHECTIEAAGSTLMSTSDFTEYIAKSFYADIQRRPEMAEVVRLIKSKLDVRVYPLYCNESATVDDAITLKDFQRSGGIFIVQTNAEDSRLVLPEELQKLVDTAEQLQNELTATKKALNEKRRLLEKKKNDIDVKDRSLKKLRQHVAEKDALLTEFKKRSASALKASMLIYSEQLNEVSNSKKKDKKKVDKQTMAREMKKLTQEHQQKLEAALKEASKKHARELDELTRVHQASQSKLQERHRDHLKQQTLKFAKSMEETNERHREQLRLAEQRRTQELEECERKRQEEVQNLETHLDDVEFMLDVLRKEGRRKTTLPDAVNKAA